MTHPTRPGRAAVLLAGALLLAAAPSSAQDSQLEPLLPDEPEADEPAPEADTPDQPEPAFADSDEVLAPAISAITVRELAETELAGDEADEGLRVMLPSFSERAVSAVRRFLAGHLDEPLTLNRLNDMVAGLVQRLDESGYPFVDVIVPAGQDVTDGAVEVVVLLAELSAIEVRGAEHFSEQHIRDETRLAVGDKLTGRRLARDLDWLNRNPFRRVGTVHQRGAEPGQSTMTLRVRDRRPWRVYAGYENTGTELTGEDRLLAGVNHGNLFGRGHRIGYQATTSMDSSDFVAHSARYTAPLPWQHELNLFGVHQESDPPADAAGFDLSAETTQLGARYHIPLVSGLDSRLTHEVLVGFDYKESNNDLLFGGAQVQAVDTEIAQWLVGYDFRLPGRAGRTEGHVEVVYGPDRDSQSAAFAAQRTGASPEYLYARAGLSRVTSLGGHWRWQVDVTGQWADGNLLPSEQLGIGGQSTVRGYEEFEQTGDRGVLASTELHRALDLGVPHVDAADVFVFYDYGLVSNVDRLEDERNNRDLMSVGAGVSLRLGGLASLRIEYGEQLEAPRPGAGKGERLHASLLIAY